MGCVFGRCRLLCGPVILTVMMLTGPARAQFTNVTGSAFPVTAGAFGVAWGDYDGDDDDDLFVTRLHNVASDIYRNDNGQFVPLGIGTALGLTSDATGVAWADADNDGDLDVYIARFGNDVLWRNDGGGTFTNMSAGLPASPEDGHGVVWGDYDADGDVDLYVANRDSAANHLLRNDGNFQFINLAVGDVRGFAAAVAASAADVDGDGDLDLLSTAFDDFGVATLLENTGLMTFVDITPASLRTNMAWSEGTAWGDYDNDGDFDLVVARSNPNLPNRLFLNNGSGQFVDVSGGAILDVNYDRGVAWWDFDNDGDLDVSASGDDSHRLLRNDDGDFSPATPPSMVYSGIGHGLAWADYDNDGDLDMAFADFATGVNLFRNDLASGAHWLQLRLEGSISNRAAIGATAVIFTASGRQMRQVEGGGNYCSQNTLVLAFGLGELSAVDSLIVRWPSGVTLLVCNPPVDTVLRLVEPATSVTLCACACDCHGDPQCDQVINDIQDVVRVIGVAFRGDPELSDPNPNCLYDRGDVDCDGQTTVVDVVKVVNVAFRAADPAMEFCNPCP